MYLSNFLQERQVLQPEHQPPPRDHPRNRQLKVARMEQMALQEPLFLCLSSPQDLPLPIRQEV